MSLERAEAQAMRAMGRRMAEQVSEVSSRPDGGMSRVFARVTKVYGDGRLDLDKGSESYPMPILGVRMTTGCSTPLVGDVAVVDTYGYVPLVTGILANADNGPYVSWSSGIVSAQRNGDVVCLMVDGEVSASGSWGGAVLATLPEALRPPYRMRCPLTVSSFAGTAIVEVRDDGTVSVLGKGNVGLGGGGEWVYGNMAWVSRA